MSGLFTTLSASVKALSAHSSAIDAAGRNLANVNNPNYSRQRIVYGDRGTVVTPQGAQSLGLEALAVQQLRDSLLDRQVVREIALQNSFESQQKFLERAELALGENINRTSSTADMTTSASGVSGALDDFFNSFQSLAVRPTDAGERQVVLQKAATLVDRLNITDTRLSQLQSDIDEQVGGDLNDTNRLLATIADLNAQIGRIEIANPGTAVDLRDQRQAKLEELAAKLPIETRPGSGGQIDVFVRDNAGAEVTLVTAATVTGPVTVSGSTLSAGNPATPISVPSGSIRGALDVRDGAIQSLRDDLNKLAQQLVTSVNAAYNSGGVAGADFFTASGTTAGTIKLASGLNAASLRASSGAAGSNDVALAVASVASQRFSVSSGDAIDGTLGQYYTRMVSGLGAALSSATACAEDQTGIATLVRTQRDGVSGVSMDEEMADLVRFQRAFQASSRVFSVVDELLDTVVNGLGR